ncbi:hypothetical protein ACHELX_004432, partial [Vibrio vulnificus]
FSGGFVKVSFWKFRDFLWNNAYIAVPLVTTLLSLIWIVLDFGPEPFVVFFSSLIAMSVVYQQRSDKWYTSIKGSLWEINFRCMSDEHAEEFVAKNLEKFDFVVKWNVRGHGDCIRTLSIDTYDCYKAGFEREALFWGGCKVYSIEVNSRHVWELEEI